MPPRQRWRLPEAPGALYRHRVLLCASWIFGALVGWGFGIALLIDPGKSGMAGRFAGVGFGIVMTLTVTISVLPRSSRSVRVDEQGLWVSGHLVVARRDIKGFAPYEVWQAAAAATPKVSKSWSYSTVLPFTGLPHPRRGDEELATVVIPLWQDCTNTGGAMTPGVVVVTREVVGGSYVGWALVSWRRSALLEALRQAAPDAVEGSVRHEFRSDAPYEAVNEAKVLVRDALAARG